MPDLVAADITVTVEKRQRIGRDRRNRCKIEFGDGAKTYPSGGVPMPAFGSFGLGKVLDYLVLIDSDDSSGVLWKYDKDNNKLRGYEVGGVAGQVYTGAAQPADLVVEEVVAVSSNTGTLAHVPMYIIAVEVTAGSTTGAFDVIPTGKTPLTTQVAVTFTSGLMTFVSGDAVTSVRVTYIPQKAGTPFVVANLVVDDSKTAAAAKVNLSDRACLVQYIWNDTNGVLTAAEPSGEAPSATNTSVLDINDSGNSSVDTHSDDDGDTLLITYVKFSALPDTSMFIDDTDITLSSEVWDFTSDGGIAPIVVPGFGTQLVGEAAAAANSLASWGGPSDTAADGVAKWEPGLNTITTNQSAAMLTTAISWLILNPALYAPQTPAGTNAAGSDASAAELDAAADAPAAQTLYAEAVGF